MDLQAAAIEARDALDAIELFYQKGWTDGLPVIPPTEGRIRAMLDAVQMQPDKENERSSPLALCFR